MSSNARLNAFLHATSKQFEGHSSEIAGRIAEALRVQRTASLALDPNEIAVTAALPDVLSGNTDDVLRRLAACIGDLHWRVAGFGKLPAVATGKLAVAELIGPQGLFRDESIRIGLLFQREGFEYPTHRHAAEELYFVLKGTALWSLGAAEPVALPPGSFVHHRPFQPHGMTTRAEPILALWGWTGDIAGSSYST